MANSVNIDLLDPAPIVFTVGDKELRFSVLISAKDGFRLRRLMNQLGEALENASVDDFEREAEDLHDILCSLEESHPETLPLTLGGMLKVATTLWQRAMGADDEALKESAEDDADPPSNRATRRKRSTSAAGSAASRKPSTTRRRTGSTSP
jgi:hypothetical protein